MLTGVPVDVELALMVMLGSLAGGVAGSFVQSRLSPPAIRRFLSLLLVVVAVILVVKA